MTNEEISNEKRGGKVPVVVDAPLQTPQPVREIRIKIYPGGQITADVSEGIDGFTSLAALAEIIYKEWEYYFQAPDHPPLAGYGKVCLELEAGDLTLRFVSGPTLDSMKADPAQAKAMLVQAWLYLCQKTTRGTFDPKAALLDGLRLTPTKPKRKAVTRGKRNHPKRK